MKEDKVEVQSNLFCNFVKQTILNLIALLATTSNDCLRIINTSGNHLIIHIFSYKIIYAQIYSTMHSIY